jgi:uncharacterized protein
LSYYLDTSVLVAYYVPEALSNKVQTFLQKHPQPFISELTQLEFYSALAIRVRTMTLARNDAEKVIALFENHLKNGYYLQADVERTHFEKAREFITGFTVPIKAPDALHASICLLNNLVLVTSDIKLSQYAVQLGITAEPIN